MRAAQGIDGMCDGLMPDSLVRICFRRMFFTSEGAVAGGCSCGKTSEHNSYQRGDKRSFWLRSDLGNLKVIDMDEYTLYMLPIAIRLIDKEKKLKKRELRVRQLLNGKITEVNKKSNA